MGISDSLKVDLVALISSDLGPPEGRKGICDNRTWWCCPFHADSNPSLTVTANGRGWKCFGCGESGDAISWVRKRNDNCNFSQAFKTLKRFNMGSMEISSEPTRSTRSTIDGGVTLADFRDGPDSAWRSSAMKVLKKLPLAATSKVAASYLRKRGLNQAAWKTGDLRFNLKSQIIEGLTVPSGIVIPWYDETGVRAINVRKLVGAGKYIQVSGSCRRTLFPFVEIVSDKPVILCEGEFDCLLLRQCVGSVAQVFTLGSVSNYPTFATLIRLAAAPAVFIGYDGDDAGLGALEKWTMISPHIWRLQVPDAKDWTDAHLGGVDLKKFISSQIAMCL